MKYQILKIMLLIACWSFFQARPAHAQLNPFQSMYYQNRYLYNPAMAGFDPGLNLNLDYRRQWSDFPGAPKTLSFTGTYKATDRVGLGLNINDDQSGLIRSTRVVGTYGYHLPLNDRHDRLSFGLSLGVNDSRVDYNKLNGDPTDEEIAQYNQLKPYIDGDLGVAYNGGNLYVGGAIPNLQAALFKSSDYRFDADRLLFIISSGYKIPMQSEDRSFTLEPVAAYRIVKGYKDIIDAGLNFSMNNYGIYMQGIYHSNQTLGLGFGLDQRTYLLNFSYNLETGALSNYTNGAFELGIKLRLFNKSARAGGQ